MEKEHITDMPHCWCYPAKEVLENGNMVIIHRCPVCNETDCMCKSKCCDAPIIPSGIPYDGTNEEFIKMCSKCGS